DRRRVQPQRDRLDARLARTSCHARLTSAYCLARLNISAPHARRQHGRRRAASPAPVTNTGGDATMSAATTSFGLSAIGQIAITTRDLDRAIAFYRDALGLPFLFRVPNMAFFDCAGVRLMIGLPEKPEFDHPASILYYRVEDIRGAHAELKARGVPFEDEPHLVADLGD